VSGAKALTTAHPLAAPVADRADRAESDRAVSSRLRRLAENPLVWVAAWCLIRLIYNALRELVPDEAYYWVWSRHLATGYLDHPPMIAWMIALTGRLAGTNEWSVRLPAVLLTTITLLAVLWILMRRQISPVGRRTIMAMLLLGPLMAALGTLATPDTPSICFQTLALACALEAVRPGEARSRGAWWLGFGLFCGLGLLSKYTSTLLPATVGLGLCLSRGGRRTLRLPWFWIACIVAILVFSPNIAWNAHHDWASFRFQLHHGFSTQGSGRAVATSPQISLTKRLGSFAQYLGGQASVWTPLLFALGIIAIYSEVKSLHRSADAPDAASRGILVCSTIGPLVFFALTATSGRVEMNWPAFAYVPMTLIMASWLDADVRGRDGWRFGLARGGCIVAICFTVVAQVPELIWWIGPDRVQFKEMFGWRQYASIVQAERGDAALACNDYQPASELSFYLPGRPTIFAMNIRSRASAFDEFPGRPDFSAIRRLLFVGKADDLRDSFPHVELIEPAPQVVIYGKRVRGVHLVRAWR
jgi:4-amino-4-deoxy-L-arabinose transferase-like glycosyltransferase